MAALLNQPGQPQVASYIQRFIRANHPQLNPVVLGTGENIRARVEDGMNEALARRPHAQAQINQSPALALTVHEYLNRISGELNSAQQMSFRHALAEERKRANPDAPETFLTDPNSWYYSLFGGTAAQGFISTLSDLGAAGSGDNPSQIANELRLKPLSIGLDVINLSGSGGCRGCAKPHATQPLLCDTTPITPEEAAGSSLKKLAYKYLMQSDNLIGTTELLKSIHTGFHEFAHVLQNQTPEGRALFGKPGSEISADTYGALMSIRELGELGVTATRLAIYDKVAFGASTGIHQSAFAMQAALEWVGGDIGKLRSMTSEQIYQQAIKITAANSLTEQEVLDAQKHGNSMTDRGDTALVRRLMDLSERSKIDYDQERAKLRIQLGEMVSTGTLSCARPAEAPQTVSTTALATSLAPPTEETVRTAGAKPASNLPQP
jgi:hypothetical protein